MHPADTIAAISTTAAPAARIIVRASGPLTPQLCKTLTSSHSFTGATQSELSFANLKLPSWLYCFPSPHSVTGEDVAEFHIPGNPLLARMLLDELIRLGARQADPGEFTARAYFNGRIDLTEAEGVAATIAAQSEQELTAARQLMSGELARRLRPVLDGLVEMLALIEAGIDFSEEDISFLSPPQINQRLDSLDAALQKLLNESTRFDRLTHEPRIVLVGRPNAGKSTLLNALSGQDRAIVSPHAGTTRDAIWAHVELPRGMVRMIDVAGLDEAATDEISQSMQEHANRAIEEADHIVLVRDCTDVRPAIPLPRGPALCVSTKSDLAPEYRDELSISAITGSNLDILRNRLDALAFGQSSAAATLALNARHVQSISEARECLTRARDPRGLEILAMELRDALDALGEVLGSVTPDDVLGRVFATFCVGK